MISTICVYSCSFANVEAGFQQRRKAPPLFLKINLSTSFVVFLTILICPAKLGFAGAQKVEISGQQIVSYDDSIKVALEFYSNKQYDKSAEQLSDLTQKFPDRSECFFWLGCAQYQQGKFSEAQNAFKKFCELDLNSVDGHRWLAQTYIKKKLYGPAVSEYEKVLTIDPNNYEAKKALAHARQNMSDRTSENTAAGTTEMLMSSDIQSLISAGRNAMAMDTYEGYGQAVSVFEKAAKAEPNSAIIMVEMAYARLWRTLTDREEHRDNIFHLFGAPKRSKEDIANELSQAENEARKAIDLEPDNAAGHAVLAIILYQNGDNESAQKSLAIAKERAPEQRYTLMAIWVSTQDKNLRIEVAKKLVELEPQNAQMHNWLAVSHFFKGDFQDAIQNLNKALAVSPKSSRAAINLALLDKELGGLKRFSRLSNLKLVFPEYSFRLYFEKLMVVEQNIRQLLISTTCVLWLMICFFQWRMKKTNDFSKQAELYLLTQTMSKWCIRLFVMLVIYIVLTIVTTYPTMMMPPGTITAGPVPPIYFNWSIKIWISMVLFWRVFNRLYSSGRWFEAIGFYIILPSVIMIWGLDPWIHKLFTAITNMW